VVVKANQHEVAEPEPVVVSMVAMEQEEQQAMTQHKKATTAEAATNVTTAAASLAAEPSPAAVELAFQVNQATRRPRQPHLHETQCVAASLIALESENDDALIQQTRSSKKRPRPPPAARAWTPDVCVQQERPEKMK
jgi:hypothetical protein